MRTKRKKVEWVILGIAVIAIGVLAGAAPEGTSRLVSVQRLPANMDACANFDQPSATEASTDVTPQEEILLAALQQDPSATLTAQAAPPQARAGQRGAGAAGAGEGARVRRVRREGDTSVFLKRSNS